MKVDLNKIVTKCAVCREDVGEGEGYIYDLVHRHLRLTVYALAHKGGCEQKLEKHIHESPVLLSPR